MNDLDFGIYGVLILIVPVHIPFLQGAYLSFLFLGFFSFPSTLPFPSLLLIFFSLHLLFVSSPAFYGTVNCTFSFFFPFRSYGLPLHTSTSTLLHTYAHSPSFFVYGVLRSIYLHLLLHSTICLMLQKEANLFLESLGSTLYIQYSI